MSGDVIGSIDMDVVVAKVLSTVIITTLTVLCGLFPCRLMKHFGKTLIKRRRTFEYILCGAKCFSGGVFLGACFLHLIPETRNKIDAVLDQLGSRSKYPVAELLTIAGFFGVIFGEHVIRFLYYKFHEESCFPTFDRDSYSFDQDFIPTTEDPKMNGCEIECTSLKSLSNGGHSQENIQLQNRELRDDCYCAPTVNNITQNVTSNVASNNRFDMEIEPAPLTDLEVKTVVTELGRYDESKGQIRSVLLITALSFHGVFEGMALGLQALEGDVWVMCVAISIHRGILSCGMGMQYAWNNERPATIIFIISSFSILCAVGIVIGIAISAGAQLYTDVDVPNAILQSLATGTIFYIIFLNILFKELDGNKDVKKISCTFVGFAFMAIIFAIAKQ